MTHKTLATVFAASLCAAFVLAPSAFTRVTAQARQAPVFQVDATWPALPNNWILGTVTSVTVGPDNHVWIVHRPRTVAEAKRAQAAPPVLHYDAAGKFVKAWGGDGKGYDWPSAEHGISADYKGNLWFTGSGPSGGGPGASTDNMILKFSRDGKFLLQIGGRNQPGGNKDTKNFERATDVAVYQKTNEAFVADGYGNRRVIVFDADTGAFKRMWGAFGRPPDDDPPAAVPGARGAGAGGTAAGAAPAAAAAPPSTPEGSPRFANPVHGIKVSNDGLVYVADRYQSAHSGVRHRLGSMSIRSSSIAVKARRQPGSRSQPTLSRRTLYVADYGNSHLVVVNRKTLEVLYQFGTRSAKPGDFQGLHNMATDSKGNLYTAEVAPGQPPACRTPLAIAP